MTGFTGEVWQRIPAEQLARDLMDGVGPKALFESGLTWLNIEAELNELAADVAHSIKTVDEGWQGDGGEGMIGALRKLHTWLVETADMAQRNAKAAEVQAVATTVARTTMPQASEVEQLTELHTSMKTMDFPAGSMLGGGMAFVESSLKTVKAQAARVMETYEQATTPVAQPWDPVIAPKQLVKVVEVKRPDGTLVSMKGGTGRVPVAALNALVATVMAPVARTAGTSEYNVQKRQGVNPVSANIDDELVESAVVDHVDQAQTQAQATQAHTPMVGPMSAAPATSVGSGHAVSQLNLTTVDDGESVAPQGEQVAAPAVFGMAEGNQA
ncbi:PPE domain-containing protein [Gordonia sp. X0973]|uniref:PPE domain-containing protein n=1 Tax=Gordonia sp. X0973 TaxID=2742602 RepID=UPI000F540F79|nr:PPE domain-containing protein [Gordonia sp. X0973]QKT06984.1 PPE domain-containing protein [Gordonia sp. X0973]